MKEPVTNIPTLVGLELKRSWYWLLIGWGMQLGTVIVAGLIYRVNPGDYLLPFLQVMFVTVIVIVRSRVENDHRMVLLPVKQWEVVTARIGVLFIAFGSIYPLAIALYLFFNSGSAVQVMKGLIVPGFALTTLLISTLLFSQDLARLTRNSTLRYIIHVAGLMPFAVTYVGLPPQMSRESKEFLVTSLKQPSVQLVIVVIAIGLFFVDFLIFNKDHCLKEYSRIKGEVAGS